MPDFSRLQILAAVWIGGLVFVLGVSLEILSNFQALDYLQVHWNTGYQFLNSGKTHTVLILVGIGMLGFAIWKLMQNPPHSQPATIAPIVPEQSPMTQKQEMSNVGNITQHFYPQPPAERKPKPEPPKPPPEPRYNFSFAGTGIVHVMEEQDGFSRVEQPQYWRGFGRPQPAIAIEITNRPHDEFTPDYASDVIAALVIGEGQHISPILWLDNNRGSIDFSIGHPNTLLLAVADNQYSNKWAIPRYQMRQTEYGYRVVALDYWFPVGTQLDVTVELSIGGRIVKKIPLEVSWPNDKIRIVPKQIKQ